MVNDETMCHFDWHQPPNNNSGDTSNTNINLLLQMNKLLFYIVVLSVCATIKWLSTQTHTHTHPYTKEERKYVYESGNVQYAIYFIFISF